MFVYGCSLLYAQFQTATKPPWQPSSNTILQLSCIIKVRYRETKLQIRLLSSRKFKLFAAVSMRL